MNPTNYKPDYPEQIINSVNEQGKVFRKAKTSALSMILFSFSARLPKQIDHKAAVDKKLTSDWQNRELLNFYLNILNYYN